MADPRPPQSLENHTRWDPKFHFFTVPIFVLNLLYWLQHAIRHPKLFANWWFVLVAAAAVLAMFIVRLYALRNQDRIIRLEERLRLATVAPSVTASDLTHDQLIALRFCHDSELAGLASRAVSEKLSRDDIKKNIKNWRPDYSRI